MQNPHISVKITAPEILDHLLLLVHLIETEVHLPQNQQRKCRAMFWGELQIRMRAERRFT
jgi:hypothetical protein